MTEATNTTHRHNKWRQLAKRSGLAVLALFVGAMLLHWSWNLFAGDLFAAPVMQFRHAVALETLLILAGLLIAVPLGRIAHGVS